MSQNQGFDLGSLLGGLVGKRAAAGAASESSSGAAGGGAGGVPGGSMSGGMLAKLMPMVVGMLSGGGLQKMMGQLSGGGLGSQAKSWVATDQPNQPITGEQLAQALGPEQISQVARNTGMSEDLAAHAMATALPEVVNAMTPRGEVPSDVRTPDRQTMESQINRLLGSVGQEQQA